MTTKVSKKSTALVVAGSVPNVLELLAAKLAELKVVTECSYKTGGNLAGFGDIKSETKVENLVRALSSIRGKEKAYYETAAILGLTETPVFSEGGGNAADWTQDVKLRIAVIQHADTKAKLEALTEQAKGFLTKEMQYEIFLKEAGAMVAALGLTK